MHRRPLGRPACRISGQLTMVTPSLRNSADLATADSVGACLEFLFADGRYRRRWPARHGGMGMGGRGGAARTGISGAVGTNVGGTSMGGVIGAGGMVVVAAALSGTTSKDFSNLSLAAASPSFTWTIRNGRWRFAHSDGDVSSEFAGRPQRDSDDVGVTGRRGDARAVGDRHRANHGDRGGPARSRRDQPRRPLRSDRAPDRGFGADSPQPAP